MRYDILTADVPNETQYIYSLSVLEQIRNKMMETQVLVTIDACLGMSVDLARVAGQIVDPQIKNSVLSVAVQLHDSPAGRIIQALEDAKLKLSVRTAGIAHSATNNEIVDYDLLYCFFSGKAQAISDTVEYPSSV